MNEDLEPSFKKNVSDIQRIPIIDDLLDIICTATGMGFAAVARVTEDRWIACAVADKIDFGLQPGGELKVESTLCNEVRQHQNPVVFDDAVNDEVYCNHHTPEIYGLRSYISVPITLKNGRFFGTLCAIDIKPALLNNRETIGMFKFYAELLSFHLSAVEELERAELKLQEEKETAELREQFIAILGHDLRNPVGAVSSVAQLMLRMPLDDRMKRIATILRDSSFRMRELIENVLDFARGKLGNGIELQLKADEPIKDSISQCISELELVWPDAVIETKFDLQNPVTADGRRIAQLFSNLLSNALTYGKNGEPILVEISSSEEFFVLSVTNSGKKIPKAVVNNLFKPFSRGENKPGQAGLGLGLYISAEIAKAHNGTLTVESDGLATCFTLKVPQQPVLEDISLSRFINEGLTVD